MAFEDFKGDYLGFTFNGKHSSEFGIVRTSNGSRFDEDLLPNMQDKATQVPGKDGKILQESTYDVKTFKVSFAFDSLTEENLQAMRAWLGDKKIHALVFDELPYKTRYAKVTGNTTVKWLPFGNGTRIYKGEGEIQFTCYDPFAHCPRDLDPDSFVNVSEWIEASRLDMANVSVEENTLKIYNCGDIETDFLYTLPIENGVVPRGSMSCDDKILKWESFTPVDPIVKINTKMNLFEGYSADGIKSGNIYDRWVSGAYFKLPVGAVDIDFEGVAPSADKIVFDYLYF